MRYVKVSEQIFKIIRAPEAKPLTAKELKSYIWHNRIDSEWSVIEITSAVGTKTGTPPDPAV
jgi:hypothetical protein